MERFKKTKPLVPHSRLRDNTYKIKHVEIKTLTQSICVNWRLVKKEVVDGNRSGKLDVQQ